ncbi:MAG: hypothetical protein JJT94_05300 [Bernardetiaceae bacterium]|nr:hypothetical protein [Bernardetiaceae bacterium]
MLTTILLLISIALPAELSAQCAMCRATVENNFNNGDYSTGMGLNSGILYLLLMPYILIGTVAFFWYRNNKKNSGKTQRTIRFTSGN